MIGDVKITYPALYDAAGVMSANAQRAYLWLLRTEYALLIVAGIMSLDLSEAPLFFAIYAFIFIASLVTLLYRSNTKPEQEWYKGRALAESIKTTTWRYCMRAAPFGDVAKVQIRRAEFRDHLKAVLEANRHIGRHIPPDSAANDQITVEMDQVRSLGLEERKSFYLSKRIREQRLWYQKKSVSNKKAGERWVAVGVIIYIMAICSVLAHIVYPQFKLWPTEPLTVIAASIVGWMQIKKFNELASAYALTAHEIGILQGAIDDVVDEEGFSEFINEAELAFSREHTQWVARQQVI